MNTRPIAAAFLILALTAPFAAAQPAPPTDRVAALKASLQQSAVALRQYEWVENTIVSLKGEAKSNKESRCYYGADGKVAKVPIESAPEGGGKSPRGLRGKIVENKKEEISDSMQAAIGLVKQYVPLDPALIQAAKDAGRVAVNPPDAQGKSRIVIKDYLKAGDSVSIDVDAAANRLAGLSVATFTDKEKDAVTLKVAVGALNDGTVYAANIILDVAKENISVAITNSGYRKATS